tara:strand:- start:4375 stop:4758 length:384 start_codon:yes stop_codon:yes gene_type:complete
MKTTKYVIGKRFSFSASHQLNGLPDTHQCSRLHGHNYEIEVVIGSDELDATGFVLDYGELGFVKDYINENFDHRHLNDVMVVNTTAENISKLFYDFVSLYLRENFPNVKLIKVIVSETEKTFSSYAT